ncbi:class I SAM-dependent methyltransferase [Tuanshanicoccus lijuaniae]|uniref:hypothetical protein n=1 Tax=Aerococcaceae bacterium zg-1292 TaxID=2774330 RepID=UPI001938DE85|nr:class I SAM-dependent methyltransferase [Aerococcaceae bacterium zg-1292]QQA36294.1 class I SAM-dependent methyltransferase [Aerococcaceae bacterium zg-1292]
MAANKRMDEWLGIDTSYVLESHLKQGKWYYNRTESTDYKVLDCLFDRLKWTKDDVLVDVGAGTGRVLCYSALRLGIAVKGIEYAEEVVRIARDNFDSFMKKHKVPTPICIIQKKIEQYAILPEDTIFYFFNPFTVILVRPFIFNVMESFEQYPRRIQCIFYYPDTEVLSFMQYHTHFELTQEILLDEYCQDTREKIVIFELKTSGNH